MNRRRAAWKFVFASVLLFALSVPVTGWVGVLLAVVSVLCALLALRLLTVGGGH